MGCRVAGSRRGGRERQGGACAGGAGGGGHRFAVPTAGLLAGVDEGDEIGGVVADGARRVAGPLQRGVMDAQARLDGGPLGPGGAREHDGRARLVARETGIGMRVPHRAADLEGRGHDEDVDVATATQPLAGEHGRDEPGAFAVRDHAQRATELEGAADGAGRRVEDHGRESGAGRAVEAALQGARPEGLRGSRGELPGADEQADALVADAACRLAGAHGEAGVREGAGDRGEEQAGEVVGAPREARIGWVVVGCAGRWRRWSR